MRRKRKTRPTREAMKLSVPSFLASPSKKKKNKRNSSCSISHRDASFASSSSSSEGSTSSSRPNASPRSVLPHDLFGAAHGKVSARDLEAVLRRLAPDLLTAAEGAASDAGFDPDELEALGAALEQPPGGEREAEAELREAFAVFDADGDGSISAEELLGFFAAMGDDACTLEDCRRMIDGVDADGDGFVCFEDFSRMMDGQR
ncbi:putative calcium-binding protein CML18 [Canna indica]|uniref:Calcium-binding protein CML18 n=1 Tax=Canna indica TaxID=4628 RepID=A0AAQ3Q791_9LILI|nr:putative calcium-binding protein CML18 [Canna indica]